MLKTHPIKNRDLLLLVIIVGIAALMRLGEPGIVEFFHDDAMVATMAQELVSGERWAWTGIISSVGIPNPPQTIYVISLPFLFSPDPRIAIYFVMLLNVLGVAILWWIAQRYFGRTTALIAGLAYALNPWAILFSRKIWAQEYHTPILLLALTLALYGYMESRTDDETQSGRSRRAWAQVLAIPVALFGVQIHFGAWLLLPAFALILLFGRARWTWRRLALSAALCALVLLPYAIGLIQTLNSDPTRIADAANRSEAASSLRFDLQPLTLLSDLATGLGLETWMAPNEQVDMLAQVPPFAPWLFLGLLSLGGAISLVITARYRPFAALCFTWVLLPIIVFIPVWTPVYVHYFIPVLPILALLCGIGLARLIALDPAKPLGRVVLLSAFAILVLTQGMWWRGALRYVDQNHISYPGFTTPLHILEDIRAELGDTQDLLVLSYGMAWNLHHESAVWPVMMRDRAQCVRTLIGEGYAVFPQGPFSVLVAPDAPADPVMNLYQNAQPRIFPEREGGSAYTLYEWDSAPVWELTPVTHLDDAARFDMGVSLSGYSTSDGLLLLEWRLPQGRRGLDYQYSGQFFDAAGERIAQIDQPFWQGAHWCEGDRLITWQPLPDAESIADATSLQVSLYQLGTGAQSGSYLSADVLDEAGNPAGQHVRIVLPTPDQAD